MGKTLNGATYDVHQSEVLQYGIAGKENDEKVQQAQKEYEEWVQQRILQIMMEQERYQEDSKTAGVAVPIYSSESLYPSVHREINPSYSDVRSDNERNKMFDEFKESVDKRYGIDEDEKNKQFTETLKELGAKADKELVRQSKDVLGKDAPESPFDKWDTAEKTPEYLYECLEYNNMTLDKYHEYSSQSGKEYEAYTMRKYTLRNDRMIHDYLNEKYECWWYDNEKEAQENKGPGSQYDSPRYNLFNNSRNPNAHEKDPDYVYDTHDEYKDFVNDFRHQMDKFDDVRPKLTKEEIQQGKEFIDKLEKNDPNALNYSLYNKDKGELEFLKRSSSEAYGDYFRQTLESDDYKKYAAEQDALKDKNVQKENPEKSKEDDEQMAADDVNEKHQKSLQKAKQFDAEDSKNKEIDKALANGNNLLEQEQKAKSLNVYSKPDLNGYYDNFYKNGPESYANDLASDIAGATVGDAGNTFANGMVAEAGAPTPQKIGTIEMQPARNEDLQFENEKQNQSIAEMHGRQAMDQMSSNNASKYAEMLMAKYEADNKQYEATQQAYKDAGLDGPKLPGSKYTG